MTVDTALGQRWRAARPVVAGVHLDSAACSRQSFAAIDAAAGYARREAEVGGYVAAEEFAPRLAAGRVAVATLIGMTADDVVFTTGATHALDLLLAAWPPRPGVIACLPGEFAPNVAVMSANGFEVCPLPVDGLGRAVVDEVGNMLATHPPTLVHLTVVPSHRGVAQPLQDIAALCRANEVPLIVDAAQGLGHVDCVADADAVYGTSRKWLAGPRGVGVLAVRPSLADRLRPRLPPPGWATGLSPLRTLELGEANVAARVAFSLAVGEHMTAGPEQMRSRLADAGRLTREALANLAGWRVVEPMDSPTAITTLAPTGGADVALVRDQLISQHCIVTTVAGPDRAPMELREPVLRLSPHVDVDAEDLARFADALCALTPLCVR
jgi:hercynylcysteine S-oxide lyase